MAGFEDYVAVPATTQAPALPTPSSGGFSDYITAPQASAPPAAMPTMPEPVMQGYNTDPTVPAPADQGLTIQGYISNTMNDIGQISGGIGAAGSAVAGRMDDWLNPHALWDKNKSVQDKFMAAQQYMPTILSGQKNKDLDMRGLFQHDTDGINAAKLGVGVAKQYYDTYGKPITEATDTKSLQPLMKLAKLPYEKPVSTALDMLPFVGPVAKAINPKVVSAFKFVDEAATKATPFYSQLKSDVQAAQALGAATSKWNNKFINEVASRLDTVEQAYKRIPEDLRDKVIPAGEMRDPALYAQLAANPDVAQFWKLANQADGRLVGELIKAGALTREEYLVAKYGPYTRAVNGIDEAALWTPDGQKMLLKAKHDLDKRGIQPTYMGLMTANQVRGALKLKGGLFGRTGARQAYIAEDLATPAPTGAAQPKGIMPRLSSAMIQKQIDSLQKLITENPLSAYVQRVEEPGVARAGIDKPHGIYTSPGDVVSPHADLGGTTHWWKRNPKANILSVTPEPVTTNRGFLPGGAGAGVHALDALLGKAVAEGLRKLPKSALLEKVKLEYPKVAWDKYHDAQEILEGYGGIKAREAGFDAIEAIDHAAPEFSEYVALTKQAMHEAPAPATDAVARLANLHKLLAKARTEEANVLPSVKPQSSPTPDFLKAREAGDRIAGKHHNDALDVHTARFVQGLQLLRLKDFFADIIQNPTIIKDGIKFDLHEFMQDLGKVSGTRPEVVSKYIEDLPQHINLPSSAYNRLMSLTGNAKVGINSLNPQPLSALATLSKNMMLGFDMAWAVNQSAQNMMLLGLSTFRGIKDIPASLMAYAMVLDKDVRSALPKHWGANFSDITPTSSALRGAVWQDMADKMDKYGMHLDPKIVQDVAKIMAPAQIYMENVFGAAQAGDALARATYGAYHMLHAVENAPAAVKPALKDMLDFMAAKQKVLANLNDEKLVEQAGKDINDLFGKYDSLTAQDWKLMRTIFPFWLWWMHSVTLTKHIAANAPLKTSLMMHLDKQIPIQFQTEDMPDSTKKMGALPMYDYNGNRRVSPNGYPELMNKPGFTPTGQVPELVIQGMHIGAGGPGNGGFPLMNPAISGTIMLSGRDPSNLQPFQDPHNYKVRGAQYNDKGEEVTATSLPIQNLVGKAVTPRIEAWAREVLASPYQPSAFTTFGDGAYKLDSSTQEPLLNFGPGERFFHMMTKLKPMEQRFDANQEATINNMKKKNFLKAQARQQGVTQQDPTAFDINWGKFLQGDVPAK